MEMRKGVKGGKRDSVEIFLAMRMPEIYVANKRKLKAFSVLEEFNEISKSEKKTRKFSASLVKNEYRRLSRHNCFLFSSFRRTVFSSRSACELWNV